MTNTEPTSTPVARRREGAGTFFGLVVGLFVGVLVAALVLPDNADVDVATPGGAPSLGTGDLGAAPATEAATTVDGAGPTNDGTRGGSPAPAAPAGSAPADGPGTDAPGQAGGTAGSGAAAGETSSVPPPSTGGEGSSTDYIGDRFPQKAEPGVASDSLTIGVALLDISALGNLPQYNQGRPEDHYGAILAAWERDSVSPVHGRKVRFVFRRYNVLSQEDQRAACNYLVKDRKVFMVIATVFFRVGGDCVTRENQVPLLTSDATDEAALARGDPFFFALAMSDDRVMRNLAYWAHHEGHIDGPIGIYYNNSTPLEVSLVGQFERELQRLGHRIAAEATTNTDDGSQNDLLAVRRFQQAGVEVAFLFTSREGFMRAAQSQGYKPTYLDSDHNYGTTDAATATYPPEQFEGTLAITGRRGGESQAGYPKTPEQTKCLADYRAHTGRSPEDDSFEQQMVYHSCDAANAVMLALQRLGSSVTHEGFVAALETFRSVRLARSGHATFGPGKHHGVDYFRTVQWQSSCTCFKALGDFRPLFAP